MGDAAYRQLGIYAIPQDMVLSVVVPVYNERATLENLLERVRAVPLRKQIILVDDCSTDGSGDLLRTIQQQRGNDPMNTITVCFHAQNQGKGAALKAWEKIRPTDEIVSQMRDALAWQCKQPQWSKDGGVYVPNPATYLNQRRWEDEPFFPVQPANTTDAVMARLQAIERGEIRR